MNRSCVCGCTTFFTIKKGTQTGLYCMKCGKWQKWLTKDEANLFEYENKQNNQTDLYNRLLNRINQSAIRMSTVKEPHIYMKAVGTTELKRILAEEFSI